MFFDLNVPVPNLLSQDPPKVSQKKKGKGKQPEASNASTPSPSFSIQQIQTLDSRVELLEQLGYTAVAFNQTVHKRVDPKTHFNPLDGLVAQLKQRPNILYLKRLTIILDEDSEKGFGLINANASIFQSYDLISLLPTTAASFSLACLTHSLPSPLTAHIIALPLTIPRLPFYLKHTLVRTALKNGAVFEISYAGALGGDLDELSMDAGAAESGTGAQRNWWAASRELCRVTKGKGIVIGSGATNEADLRAPRDVANIISLLGVAQDQALNTLFKTPKSLLIRAATRKTHKAVLSEPRVVIPSQHLPQDVDASIPDAETPMPSNEKEPTRASPTPMEVPTASAPASDIPSATSTPTTNLVPKRPRDDNVDDNAGKPNEGSKKKKRKKNVLPP